MFQFLLKQDFDSLVLRNPLHRFNMRGPCAACEYYMICVFLIISAVSAASLSDKRINENIGSSAAGDASLRSLNGRSPSDSNIEKPTQANNVTTTIATLNVEKNCTEHNSTSGECGKTIVAAGHNTIWPEWVDKNKEILERTMYVLLVITVIVVLYFIIKMIRLRRRKSKTRRYGVLNTSERDNLEMTPLDQDDDDDDTTVFEVNGHGRNGRK